MKILLKTLALLSLLLTSASAYSLQGLNVITITTDDPQGYVKWLTDAQPIFQKAQGDRVMAQGICSPTAGGNEANEHYVWSFAPSQAAMFGGNSMFEDKDVQRSLKRIASKREVTRRDAYYVAKGDSVGDAGTTNANYNLVSRTNDVSGYVKALTNMEVAAARNGFDDISVALYVSVASGDRAGTVMASVQAPNGDRLGAFFDQRESSWMTESMSTFDGIRQPVIDFMMQCTTLSVNN
ncbi:hypothetical protein OAO62_02075 [Gammaproteobacteria bacterium]|nr:hypothetical protein [Gammaproteobacteria bacterium]